MQAQLLSIAGKLYISISSLNNIIKHRLFCAPQDLVVRLDVLSSDHV